MGVIGGMVVHTNDICCWCFSLITVVILSDSNEASRRLDSSTKNRFNITKVVLSYCQKPVACRLETDTVWQRISEMTGSQKKVLLSRKSWLIPFLLLQGAWREGSWGKIVSWSCWWHRSPTRAWHCGGLRTFSWSSPFIGAMPMVLLVTLQICVLESSFSSQRKPIIRCLLFGFFVWGFIG